MSDIVSRLRCTVLGGEMDAADVVEAADEIERLETENAKLRANADYEQTLGRKVDALEVENHRLRAALEMAYANLKAHLSCSLSTQESCRLLGEARNAARAALEQKE